MLVFFKRKQAVLYSIISANTPKINHSSSKACGNNWDLTAIQMSRHCRNIRLVSFSRYSLDALFKPYQVTDKRVYSKLNNCTIFPLRTEIIRHMLACYGPRRKDKQYHRSLVILLGLFVLRSSSVSIFSSHFSEISLCSSILLFHQIEVERKNTAIHADGHLALSNGSSLLQHPEGNLRTLQDADVGYESDFSRVRMLTVKKYSFLDNDTYQITPKWADFYFGD